MATIPDEKKKGSEPTPDEKIEQSGESGESASECGPAAPQAARPPRPPEPRRRGFAPTSDLHGAISANSTEDLGRETD